MLKCIVIPSKGREISGILPNNQRISERTEIILNKREILKCMKNASVYGIRNDGTEVLLTDSESINREVMNKVKERTGQIFKEESQPSVLDITGTKRMEKKEIINEVKNSPNYSKNNRRDNKNSKK